MIQCPLLLSFDHRISLIPTEIKVVAARGEVSLYNLRAPTGQTEGNFQFIFHFKWRWKSSDAAKGLNVAAVKFTFTIVCLALPSEHGGPLFNHNISPRAGFGRRRAWRCRFPWLLTFGALCQWPHIHYIQYEGFIFFHATLKSLQGQIQCWSSQYTVSLWRSLCKCSVWQITDLMYLVK